MFYFGTIGFGNASIRTDTFGVFSLLPLGVVAQFSVAAIPVSARGAFLSCFVAEDQFDWVGGGVARPSRVASGPRGGASGGCLGVSLCGSLRATPALCLPPPAADVWVTFRLVVCGFVPYVFEVPCRLRTCRLVFHCEVCGGFTRVGCSQNRARGRIVPSRGWGRG